MSVLVAEYDAHGGGGGGGGVRARALRGRTKPNSGGVGAVRAHSWLGKWVPLRYGAREIRVPLLFYLYCAIYVKYLMLNILERAFWGLQPFQGFLQLENVKKYSPQMFFFMKMIKPGTYVN